MEGAKKLQALGLEIRSKSSGDGCGDFDVERGMTFRVGFQNLP
jgi:hypothetical protein